jgi:hypothetical protein
VYFTFDIYFLFQIPDMSFIDMCTLISQKCPTAIADAFFHTYVFVFQYSISLFSLQTLRQSDDVRTCCDVTTQNTTSTTFNDYDPSTLIDIQCRHDAIFTSATTATGAPFVKRDCVLGLYC